MSQIPDIVKSLRFQLRDWDGKNRFAFSKVNALTISEAAATIEALARLNAELGAMLAGPPASQSDRAVVAVGPITRIKGTDSISCPGLPSGMMCFGWAEQGWAINDKDGKRVATGDWGDCATIHLESSQSDEALVEAVDQPPRHVTDADRASQFISPSDGDHAELTALFRAHRNSAERELAELKGTLMKAGPIHAGPISGEHGRRYPRARQVVIEFEDGGGAYDFYETLVRLRIYFNEV